MYFWQLDTLHGALFFMLLVRFYDILTPVQHGRFEYCQELNSHWNSGYFIQEISL